MTIEEKAAAHYDTIPMEDRILCGAETRRRIIKDAYLAGAHEALAGQWRKSDDTEGLQDGERVIVAIQRTDNSIKYFHAAYYHNGKFWDDSDDSEIYFCNLWMRLPEPPKDESE